MTRTAAACLLSLLIGLAALSSGAGAKALSAGAAASGAAHRSSTGLNPNVQLSALSCASTGNCAAVGTFEDALGDSQGILVDEAGGRWASSVEAVVPAGASTDPFKAADGGGIADVACPGVGSCVAVGRYTDSVGIDHGVAVTESAGTWRPGVELALPANAIRAQRPKTGATEDVSVAGVSCSSVGNCVAIGDYQTTAEVWEGLIVREVNGRWSRGAQTPLPQGAPVEGQDVVLVSIDCLPGGCTIAGDYVDAQGHQQALLIRGDGTSWTASPAPAAPGDANTDPNISPTEVSCSDAQDCAAVGTYVNPLENSLPVTFTETDDSWEAGAGVTLPAGAAPAGTVGDQTAVLSSVACPQTGDCVAVGWYFDNDENGQGLVVDEQSGSWKPGAETTLPANAVGGLEKQSAGLDWVSCASAGNCLATGVYTDIGYNSQGLLLSEVNGVWQQALESPLPHKAANQQTAATNQADCTAVGDCAVIGEYYDTHGRLLGFTISEVNGSFGRPAAVSVPGATAAEVKLSLDAILFPYGKTSGLAGIRKARGFDFNFVAPAAGTATLDWYVSADHRRVLVGRGHVDAEAAGSAKLRLTLTAAGLSMLGEAKQVRITASASFSPLDRRLSAQRTTYLFTLR